MNSLFANIFLAIQKRLADLKDNDDKPYLGTVDHDLQQLMFDKPPVSWPCGLIGAFNFSFKNMSENAQSGSGTISIKLGFMPYSSSSNLTPEAYRKKAINYYNIEQIIHLALQGWSPEWIEENVDLLADVAGSLNRTNARSLPRNDDIIVREITYSLGIDDYSTKPVRGTAPRPVITISPEID